MMTNLTEISTESMMALTAVELRKLGALAGIKGASKGKKDELLKALVIVRHEQLVAQEAERVQAAAAEATPATETAEPAAEAKPRKGSCEICATRPRMNPRRMQAVHGVEFPYCEPCYEAANWENTHSDEAHQDTPDEACWVCHPELDESKADYQPRRVGVDRKGQVVHAKGDKYEVVAKAAEAAGFSVSAETKDGLRVLRAMTATDELTVGWDGRGRYAYEASSWNGKRVRNVAEALRLLAANG